MRFYNVSVLILFALLLIACGEEENEVESAPALVVKDQTFRVYNSVSPYSYIGNIVVQDGKGNILLPSDGVSYSRSSLSQNGRFYISSDIVRKPSQLNNFNLFTGNSASDLRDLNLKPRENGSLELPIELELQFSRDGIEGRTVVNPIITIIVEEGFCFQEDWIGKYVSRETCGDVTFDLEINNMTQGDLLFPTYSIRRFENSKSESTGSILVLNGDCTAESYNPSAYSTFNFELVDDEINLNIGKGGIFFRGCDNTTITLTRE